MSLRGWISVLTFVLITVVLFFSRHELVHAWHLLNRVNIWILLLLLPTQVLVYYAGGEMIFSYLRGKKNIVDVRQLHLAQIALEGNFVNHLFPSGGLSGTSYLTWRLGHLGVSAGRATMAQVVRHAVTFMAFTILLLFALFAITLDGSINRWIILSSSLLIGLMTSSIVGAIFLLSSKRRTEAFSGWLAQSSAAAMRFLTLGHRHRGLSLAKVREFFEDMHHDVLELRHEKKLLIQPFWWAVLYVTMDAGLFMITFWALGEMVNPAVVLVAYGIAILPGFLMLTPGGAGAYEATMIAFLITAGVAQGAAIAGVVLTRVILLLGTLIMGYVFYQRALLKYGKSKSKI